MYTRRNVFELGGDWADPILWYARGVGEMMKLPLDDPFSWGFFAAIHGFHPEEWRRHGLPVSPLPSTSMRETFWAQCQHGSWYFLPWHRGYLLAFEETLRAQIVRLGGPEDWALPYWDYFKNSSNGRASLPPAFEETRLPNGEENPLYVEQRYGPDDGHDVFVQLSRKMLEAMKDGPFIGVSGNTSPGFGGGETVFSHLGRAPGTFEVTPHGPVHSQIGGWRDGDPRFSGLLADPRLAGYDPIFWLHHANVDRLWEVWRRKNPGNLDPALERWIRGPQPPQRSFLMPRVGRVDPWRYTPGEMSDLTALGYGYDAYEMPSLPGDAEFRASWTADGVERTPFRSPRAMNVENDEQVELIGANESQVALEGSETSTSVRIDGEGRDKVRASFAAFTAFAVPDAEAVPPDRVFLNLENVRGRSDGTSFSVYVGVPDGENPVDHPESLAGEIGLFGVSQASETDGEHGGAGLSFVLEITDIVDRLALRDEFDLTELGVRLVPMRNVPRAAEIQIGRISVYRQGRSR